MSFKNNKSVISWCLYDWANSVISTIIFTFIFAIYFSREIVGDDVLGSVYWGYAVGFSGVCIAIAGPILGSISDAYGPRKPILGGLSGITIIATALLFFALPDTSFTLYALILVGVAIIGFELGQAQYNAMLSDIAPSDKIGRISGMAWSMGYFGGLICLTLALFGFIGMGDNGSGFLNLSIDNALNVRATCLLAALWSLVFAIPLFIFCDDKAKIKRENGLLAKSFRQLWQTIKSLFSTSGNIGRFLLASAIYRDGLNTLFVVGGLYAAGTFQMTFEEILIFAIGLNVASGVGAFGFAYFDDYVGAKTTIIVSLIALITLGVGIITVDDKDIFMMLAMGIGLFIGPAQSSSRSMMARLAPQNSSAEIFGLYAMTGKSISFVGPTLFAFLTQMMESQRWGITAIIAMWVLGLLILLRVKER